MSANIPCLNPALCGVQSHRPGTVAKCMTATGSASGASATAAPNLTKPVLAGPPAQAPATLGETIDAEMGNYVVEPGDEDDIRASALDNARASTGFNGHEDDVLPASELASINSNYSDHLGSRLFTEDGSLPDLKQRYSATKVTDSTTVNGYLDEAMDYYNVPQGDRADRRALALGAVSDLHATAIDGDEVRPVSEVRDIQEQMETHYGASMLNEHRIQLGTVPAAQPRRRFVSRLLGR